jgi:hypothetical protein
MAITAPQAAVSTPTSPQQAPDGLAGGSGSSAGNTAAGGSAGKGRGKRGSFIEPKYGKRQPKCFPISEAELGELYGIGAFVAIAFSITTGCGSFAIGIFKDLAINQMQIQKETIETWTYYAWVCIFISFVSLVIGIILVRQGHTKIKKIKNETAFD